MHQVTILTLVVVAFAAVYFAQKVLARGVGMVAGAVTGNTRTRGLAAVHTRLDFTAPVPGSQIIEQVRSTLELKPNGGFSTGLKLGARAGDGSDLMIEAGNPLATHLQYLVSTEPTSEGCRGFAGVGSWVEDAGLVTMTDSIERIHKHVRAAVHHSGGTVSESSSK